MLFALGRGQTGSRASSSSYLAPSLPLDLSLGLHESLAGGEKGDSAGINAGRRAYVRPRPRRPRAYVSTYAREEETETSLLLTKEFARRPFSLRTLDNEDRDRAGRTSVRARRDREKKL